jgi:hypothetical protein
VTMLDHMTALALRYDDRPGRFRTGHRGGTGFVRDARAPLQPSPMDESRKMKMQALQERIERDEYDVDPRKVAEAIVAKLLAAKSETK